MKRNCLFIILVCLSALAFFAACNQKYPGYKKNADGLYYKFYKHDASALKPKQSDFLKVAMTCYLNDVPYFDWREEEAGVYAQLSESKFSGDLQSAYSMMNLGDSASFYIKADSIAFLYYEQDPKAVGLGPDDYFRYEIKLQEVLTKEEFQVNVDKMKERLIKESKTAFETYIEENGINVTPSESGIYVIPIEKGKGRCPMAGEEVELDFSASMLNGQLLGTTYGKDETFSFVLGEGSVIAVWEEVVPQMHVGDRVKAVVPFEMAYGERSLQSMPPYSNLVYDIKLLKITTVEELQKQAEETVKKQKDESESAFQSFLTENNIVDHTESGLYYAKSLVTGGKSPVRGTTARIKYVASFLDGTVLGTSDELGEYYEIPIGKRKVLKGLEEGVCLMKVGEKARLVLPYHLAYDEESPEGIPPFSNLVFDVELLDVVSSNK